MVVTALDFCSHFRSDFDGDVEGNVSLRDLYPGTRAYGHSVVMANAPYDSHRILGAYFCVLSNSNLSYANGRCHFHVHPKMPYGGLIGIILADV